MRGLADAALAGLNAEPEAHRAVQERIARHRRRYGALIEAAKNDAIGVQQARFEKTENARPRTPWLLRWHGRGAEALLDQREELA